MSAAAIHRAGKRTVLVERKPRAGFGIADPDRREVGCVTLRLPMPPSVNSIWAYGRGGVRTSIGCDAWKKAAGWELQAQKPGRVGGAYTLHLQFCRAETKADLGNLEKIVSDLLEEHRVIANDKHAERIELSWGAEAGVIVTVISTREVAA